MRLSSPKRKRQRGSAMMLMTIMVPLLLIPLVGLAIDGSRLYIVQSKLSAAVDGAALGSGRLLGTNANTTEIAGEFLRANFPSGFWSASPPQSTITYTNNLGVQTISVSATTVLPLTFARLLGQTGALVSANSVATRRVTRLVMVLDRSGSMNNTDPVTGANVFQTMQAGAEWFAAQFTPGYDEIGLVVFSGSALVAYPETHPWVNDPAGAGGPDKAFSTNPQTQTGPIFDQLATMAVGGGTGTPEALSQAFIEMQKAHNRDLAANGVDNTLNTIVLFTDGVPDGIATYLNDPAHNSLKARGAYPAGATCNNNPANGNASTQMRGYIVAGGCPSGTPSCTGWSGAYGLMRLAAFDATNSLTWWLSSGVSDYKPGDPPSSLVGCTKEGSNGKQLTQSGNNLTLEELAKIPDLDLYGNSTSGAAYQNSWLYDGSHYWRDIHSYNNTQPTDPYNIAEAAWNATDAIGNTIRAQNIMNPIQIFTIGYSGNGGTDTGLLNRLANTPQSTSFVSTQPVGKFYLVNNTTELVSAFNQVASSILRLAQ